MLIIPRTPSPSPLPTPVARIPSPVKPEPLHERPLDELSREELLELARAQKVYSFLSFPRNFLVKWGTHITIVISNSGEGRNNFQLKRKSTPPSSRTKFKPRSKKRYNKKWNPSTKQASSGDAMTSTRTGTIFKSQCQGPFASSPLPVKLKQSSLKATRRVKSAWQQNQQNRNTRLRGVDFISTFA